MKNCLSSSKFANLLFVNVQIGDVRATALFDTGAGMTVIVQSLLHRLRAAPEKEVLRAGNNNGMVRGLQTAVIPSIQLGDVCMENCKVLVTDDADFALSDESGRIFPAETLLGWDVISRYRWSYSAKDESLPDDLFAGCRYLRQAIRSTDGDRGIAGIRFSGRSRLAAGAGVQASVMNNTARKIPIP